MTTPTRGAGIFRDCLHHKLYNSIVDVALVYGVDESYKALDINEEGSIHDVYDRLLVRDIKLQFLQVLGHCQVYPNRTKAFSPVSTPTTDGFGEGISRKFHIEDLGLSWETVETLQLFMYPEGPQLCAAEKEPACVPMLLTDILGSRSYAVGLKFTRPFFIQKPEGGGCGHYNLIPSDVATCNCPPNSKLIYLPMCVTLVSKYPYFKFLKEALSGLYRLITDDDTDDDFWTIVKIFAEKIFLVPCLPEGMLSLEVTLPGFSSSTVVMPPRGDLHLDIRLNYPFLCLSVDNVLKVVAALLCEQTIIFTSAYYSVPALVIQCFLSYISPFEWRHSVVPIVPNDQIDMLGAPGINIMGCHANCQDHPEFLNIDDAVIVKLDEDIVISKLSYLSDFPELPEINRTRFKTQYQQLLEGDYVIDSLERLILPSAVERERARSNFEHYQDTTLSSLFLELLVGVFSHLSEGLRESRAVFEERISALPEKDQFFYRCATQTDMFSVFMLPRRMQLRDSYNVLADQLKKKARPLKSESFELPVASVNPLTRRNRLSVTTSILGVTSNPLVSKRGSGIPPTFASLSSSLVSRQTCGGSNVEESFIAWTYGKLNFFKDLQCLEMPPLNSKEFNKDKYLNQVLVILEGMMHDKSIQACCVYLYAYYKVAQGAVMNGLELFCDDLQRLALTLVPSTQRLLELKTLLNNEEKDTLQQKAFYKQLIPLRGPELKERHNSDYGLVRATSKTRKKPLTHGDFSKEVKQESVATDPESASNLFSVLQSICHSSTVSPEMFQTFLDAWKQNIQDMDSSVSACSFLVSKEPVHRVHERVLALSTNFRSHLSAHCFVILTTHRIVLLSNAGLKETTFAELHELSTTSFCKCELSLHFIGTKTPIIKLEQPSGARYINRRPKTTEPYIGFPNNALRDIWYRMFKEVIFGWQIVFARKDPTVMNQVECHIRLLLALERTGWMDDVDNNIKHRWIQKILSLQSKPVQSDTPATEVLQYRINPNTYNIEKATIESTLFVPSSIVGGEGKLWLGLGNGYLRVYDMEAHCFDSDLKIVDSRFGKTVRVSCLLLVEFHVWVGSLNKTIHILDVETLCHVSQLSYLEDEPRDLCLSKREQVVVWALLFNGTILGFDPETRERVAKIQVPNMIQHSYCTCFTIWNEVLWVGNSRGSIAILNTINRSIVNEVILPRNERQVEIKYLAVSSEDQIWCSVHSFPRSENSTYISVYNPSNQQILYTYSNLDSNYRVSFILPVKKTVWCGTKSGRIYVFSANTDKSREFGPKILDAHDDKVRSMTFTDNDLVISGSGSNDGYANVWRLMNWFDD